MLSTKMIAPEASKRVGVLVDLIGDLDVTLAELARDTFADLAVRGATDVFLATRHVGSSSADGLRVLAAALVAARARGCTIEIDPGNRRMRTALGAAGISCARGAHANRPPQARHLLIARHSANPNRSRLSIL